MACDRYAGLRRATRPRRLAELALVAAATSVVGNVYAAAPDTKYWEGSHLEAVRDEGQAISTLVAAALDELAEAAEAARDSRPYSVMDKQITPPSGDKHDYISFSRYWWPNPDTADGLPYIRRDGRVNRPLVAKGDRVSIGLLCEDFEALSLAAYLFDADRYAPPACRLIRTWFLDPATQMNPRLPYAQGVPGRSEGRGSGILDTRCFIRILDGVAVLEAIDAIPADDVDALRRWFAEYLDWLVESDLGRDERRANNNHGAWYAAQVTRIALFVGRKDIARELIDETREERLPSQIEPDGRQPHELKRTMSLHYSLFSLSALGTIARLAEDLGIDLWRYETPSGASLRGALDYAAPYAPNQDAWPHTSINRYSVSDSQSQIFYLAASRLDGRYFEYLTDAPRRTDRRVLTPLLFSAPSRGKTQADP